MLIPTFQEIEFSAHNHLYTHKGQKLQSATQLIGTLKKPFNSEYLSQKQAGERGVPQAVILAEWDEKRRNGLARGTAVHKYIDETIHGRPWQDERLPEMGAFDDWLGEWGAQLAFRRLEWMVGYPEMGVAGTVDAFAWDTQTRTYQVWDWKTGSKFNTTSPYKSYLLPPFSDLQECELNTYSLQVSLYRLILEDCGKIPTSAGFILHLRGDGSGKVYHTIDFRARLRDWLESRKG